MKVIPETCRGTNFDIYVFISWYLNPIDICFFFKLYKDKSMYKIILCIFVFVHTWFLAITLCLSCVVNVSLHLILGNHSVLIQRKLHWTKIVLICKHGLVGGIIVLDVSLPSALTIINLMVKTFQLWSKIEPSLRSGSPMQLLFLFSEIMFFIW